MGCRIDEAAKSGTLGQILIESITKRHFEDHSTTSLHCLNKAELIYLFDLIYIVHNMLMFFRKEV